MPSLGYNDENSWAVDKQPKTVDNCWIVVEKDLNNLLISACKREFWTRFTVLW